MRRSGVFRSATAAGLAMLVTTRADAQPGDAGTLAEQLFAQGRDLARENRGWSASARATTGGTTSSGTPGPTT